MLETTVGKESILPHNERAGSTWGSAGRRRPRPSNGAGPNASEKATWDLFVVGYGPTRTLAANCSPERRLELARDFIVFHEQYRNEISVAMPREYLCTLGTRK